MLMERMYADHRGIGVDRVALGEVCTGGKGGMTICRLRLGNLRHDDNQMSTIIILLPTQERQSRTRRQVSYSTFKSTDYTRPPPPPKKGKKRKKRRKK